MRNPLEVLKAKEQELAKVKCEIEALSLVLPLLGEESDIIPSAAISSSAFPSRIAQRVRQLP